MTKHGHVFAGLVPYPKLALLLAFPSAFSTHSQQSDARTGVRGDACQWEVTVCPWSCFLPVVCESTSSGEHGLMPSTKNDFQQGCM